MKKPLSVLLAACMLITALAGCGKNNSAASTEAAVQSSETAVTESLTESTAESKSESAGTTASANDSVTLKLGVPTAPPTLPVLHMMEENMLGDNVNIELDIWNSSEQLLAMVQDSEHDMFAFPLTVVAKLSNKGMPVRLMNVNTWGVTYFMTTDPDFKTWSDLKGKTVYVPIQSSPPDALTQYFINEAGLKVGEDVTLVYASASEIASLLASGNAEYATLFEPQVTSAMSQNENVIRALSFEEEWQRTTNTNTMIPNAGWGTTQTFIDAHPDLVKNFQDAYKESVQWVLDNPADAAALSEKYLGMKAAVVEKAIPNMGLHFKSAQDAHEELNTFYQLLNDFDASMIGGSLPDNSMYYAD